MNSTSNPIQADRLIEPETTIERTVQYGLDHYPELDKEEHWQKPRPNLTARAGRSVTLCRHPFLDLMDVVFHQTYNSQTIKTPTSRHKERRSF